MLPDRSILIVQKLVENTKIQKFKCDNLGDFQKLWGREPLVFAQKSFKLEVNLNSEKKFIILEPLVLHV